MTTRERITKFKAAVHEAGPVPVYAPALAELADILEMQQGAIERLAVLLRAMQHNMNTLNTPSGFELKYPATDDIDNLLRELGINPEGWQQ